MYTTGFEETERTWQRHFAEIEQLLEGQRGGRFCGAAADVVANGVREAKEYVAAGYGERAYVVFLRAARHLRQLGCITPDEYWYLANEPLSGLAAATLSRTGLDEFLADEGAGWGKNIDDAITSTYVHVFGVFGEPEIGELWRRNDGEEIERRKELGRRSLERSH